MQPSHDLGRARAVRAGNQEWTVRDLAGTIAEFAKLDLVQLASSQWPLLTLFGDPHVEHSCLRDVGQRRDRFNPFDLVGGRHRQHRKRVEGRRVGRRVGMLDRREIIDHGSTQHELGGDIDPLHDLALLADPLHSQNPFRRRVIHHGEKNQLGLRPVMGAIFCTDPDLTDTHAVSPEARGSAADGRHIEVEDLDRCRARHRTEGCMPPGEDVCQHPALAVGERAEWQVGGPACGDMSTFHAVPGGPDVGNRGPQPLVHANRPRRTELRAGRLRQLDPRLDADRDHDRVGTHLLCAGCHRHAVVIGLNFDH